MKNPTPRQRSKPRLESQNLNKELEQFAGFMPQIEQNDTEKLTETANILQNDTENVPDNSGQVIEQQLQPEIRARRKFTKRKTDL